MIFQFEVCGAQSAATGGLEEPIGGTGEQTGLRTVIFAGAGSKEDLCSGVKLQGVWFQESGDPFECTRTSGYWNESQ